MYLQHFACNASAIHSLCAYMSHPLIIQLLRVSYTTWLSEDSIYTVKPLYCGHPLYGKKVPLIESSPHFWDQNAHNRHVWDSTSCRDYSGVLISGGPYIEQFHFIYRN